MLDGTANRTRCSVHEVSREDTRLSIHKGSLHARVGTSSSLEGLSRSTVFILRLSQRPFISLGSLLSRLEVAIILASLSNAALEVFHERPRPCGGTRGVRERRLPRPQLGQRSHRCPGSLIQRGAALLGLFRIPLELSQGILASRELRASGNSFFCIPDTLSSSFLGRLCLSKFRGSLREIGRLLASLRKLGPHGIEITRRLLQVPLGIANPLRRLANFLARAAKFRV